MTRNRSEFEIAAGKLISVVQKEWGKELGEPGAELTQNVINLAHDLLQTRSIENAKHLLGSQTVSQFLVKFG